MALNMVLLQIILLLWPIEASLLCPTHCGIISIWYPFGIGEGCYLNKWFEVTCNDSYVSPKPYLRRLNMEISDDIYVSTDTIIVNIPVIFLNGSKTSTTEGVDLSSSPFSFSNTYNRFVATGCKKYAMVNTSQSDKNTGGCLSICTCDPNDDENAGCYDFLCTIPENRRIDNANLSGIYSGISIPNEFRSASMVDQGWLESNYLTDPYVMKDKQFVPANLGWGKRIGRCVELFSAHNTFCNSNNECLIQLSSGHACLCDGPTSPNSYRGCTGYLVCKIKGGDNCSECPYGYDNLYNNGHLRPQCYPRVIHDIYIKSRVKYIVIGCSCGVGMLVLLIVVWLLYKFIKRRKAMKLKQKFFKRNGGLLLQQHLSSNEGNIEKTKLFSSKELEKATDNYNTNRILGQGGHGTVYKGMLSEGRIVAVKKSKIMDESKLEEFINEVVILSQINHRNVVQLLGCCLETEVPLLVYEFIANGTLFKYLHDQNEEFPITWELRLRIATEIAGALSYLHSAACVPIYHRDIKSTNILLDEKYRAKVSDFGISRYVTIDKTHLTTHVLGTFGYVDPEYFQSSQFSEKSDVYSFGVVLAELLTGEKPIRSTNCEENISLATYFLCAVKENRLFEVLDARVSKEGAKEEILIIANLTRRCLNLNGKKRPTMREVAIELAGIQTSTRATISRHNCEEIDCVEGDINNHFETGSSSMKICSTDVE